MEKYEDKTPEEQKEDPVKQIVDNHKAQERQKEKEALKAALISTYSEIGDVIAMATKSYAGQIKDMIGLGVEGAYGKMVSEFAIALTWKLINPQMTPRNNSKAK